MIELEVSSAATVASRVSERAAMPVDMGQCRCSSVYQVSLEPSSRLLCKVAILRPIIRSL